jgi:UDP-N-acetylglucosamine--dolichyl-phosphate N-acetylglucosaminephosphotransferase
MTEDKYKRNKKQIVLLGGVSMLIGILVSLSLSEILLEHLELGKLFIFYFVVIVYALYGLLDDFFKFKTRYDKILATLILTIPIASLIPDTAVHFLGYVIELDGFYALLFVPMFVLFTANAINLHAGYNGLTTGLELILLIAVGIKVYMVNGFEALLFVLPVLGAVVAFFPFVKYPAKILPGNVGDFMVGGAIGGLLMINGLTWFGVCILIPHIINFILDFYTIVLTKTRDVKFGTLRADRTIEAPPTMKYKSLKFLVVSLIRLKEWQAVLILYSFTIVFCVVGLIWC